MNVKLPHKQQHSQEDDFFERDIEITVSHSRGFGMAQELCGLKTHILALCACILELGLRAIVFWLRVGPRCVFGGVLALAVFEAFRGIVAVVLSCASKH